MSDMHKALVAAQKDFGPALKTNNNPAFRSKYADLGSCIEAVLDSLHANGFFLTHEVKDSESGVIVECVLIHESGERHSSGPVYVPASKSDAHGYGSALTYARRYSLMAACGIAPEDDDGNQAAKHPREELVKSTEQTEWEAIDTDTKDMIDEALLPVKAAIARGQVASAFDEWLSLGGKWDMSTQAAAKWRLTKEDKAAFNKERSARKAAAEAKRVAA